jgi:hypothetical protein
LAALIGEAVVIGMYSATDLAWLWLNVAGTVVVMILAWLLSYVWPKKKPAETDAGL